MFGEINLYLCEPRGFCGGVTRAVKIVEGTLNKFGAPIYVYHEIVHNKHIVDDFRQRGVLFIEHLDEISDFSRPLVFSAHGVPLALEERAKEMNLISIDATCPLVKKVHKKVKDLEQEKTNIIIIGKKNHQEIIGTKGQLSNIEKVHIVSSIEDIEKLKIDNKNIGFVTQTTLSLDENKEMIEALQNKYPNINSLSKSDICYATTERQNGIKNLCKFAEAIIIIGSKNSSNSNKLKEVALVEGAKVAFLIDDASELDWEKLSTFQNIGISSGASAPEHLVEALVETFKSRYEKIKITSVKI
ncbi:MAG: 4-hydroxy-3-methylbut-2-enyl diphosphate reductase [Alphaproteobacteria bacterium]